MSALKNLWVAKKNIFFELNCLRRSKIFFFFWEQFLNFYLKFLFYSPIQGISFENFSFTFVVKRNNYTG